MKKKIALTVMSVVLLSSAAMAQENSSNDGSRMGNHANRGYQNRLNLTDEQYNKMQELRNSMRAERDTAREAQRQEMEKFYNAPKFDENEAQRLVQKHRSEKEIRRMKNRHAMTQILTPEQRSQYRDMGMGHKRNNHMKNANYMRQHPHMNGGHRGNGRMHNSW